MNYLFDVIGTVLSVDKLYRFSIKYIDQRVRILGCKKVGNHLSF